MDDNYSIDEILTAVDALQNIRKDKAKKESASKVQDASQQFDDLFNN